MHSPLGITRRDLLGTATAAGAAAMTDGLAWAQAGKRIEQFSPELENIISVEQPIEEVASGLGGELGPAEGPVWWKEGGYLLFSDIHASRRMKYTPGQA
jgi:gluconolactonase